MQREKLGFLKEWLKNKVRKPLVIRGARQVGKTWIVRDFAHQTNKFLIELNFEKQPSFESLFSSNDPNEVLKNIEISLGITIDIPNCILFLDEIQAAPHILAKLRWFAEDCPNLPVIAAGSLLDFALAKHKYSMPVGRISYMYLEPLSFEEFLIASGQVKLQESLENFKLEQSIPDAIHDKFTSLLKEYLIIGGMPAAVKSWLDDPNFSSVHQIHLDLLATYRDDFAKYSGRLGTDKLEDILNSIPLQLGQKFVFSQANSDISTPPLKQALELLTKARIAHKIISTAANGLPLAAELNKKYFKVILLDCGLCTTALGLSLHQLKSTKDLILINNGAIAEQFVGQSLRTVCPAYEDPSLYYWLRDKRGTEAELDYIIAHENQVVPIEVKAGKSGSLKSLHKFIHKKKRNIAIRFNSDKPSIGPVSVKTTSGESVNYTLLSLPLYMIGQTHRLLQAMSDSTT